MKKSLVILMALMVCCAKENTPKDGVIRVNGSWIKAENIDRIAEMYRQQMAQAYPEKALEGVTPEIKKNIARQLIANEVLTQEAKKLKVAYSEEKFQTTFSGIKKQFPDSTIGLAKELAKMGQTELDLKKQIKDGLMVDTLIKGLFNKKDSVTVEECKAFYDKNVDKFTEEKKFRVSQILFMVAPGASPDKKKVIAQKAASVLAQANAGKDFAALAKKYSDDSKTAVAGGDIGWFKRGDLMKEFDNVATPLKLNTISTVFETPAGFHIIKKTGEESLPPQTFATVQEKIKSMISLKKQNDVVKNYIDSLEKTAKIFYADSTLKMTPEEMLGANSAMGQ